MTHTHAPTRARTRTHRKTHAHTHTRTHTHTHTHTHTRAGDFCLIAGDYLRAVAVAVLTVVGGGGVVAVPGSGLVADGLARLGTAGP